MKKLGDSVRIQEAWPHTKLSLQYVSKNLKYDNLDMPLFVAGYIEAILAKVKSCKQDLIIHKLDHLRSLMYNSTFSEWSTILDLHAAVVTEIERGHRKWGDSFLDIEQKVLSVSSSKKDSNKTVTKVLLTLILCSAKHISQANAIKPHHIL